MTEKSNMYVNFILVFSFSNNHDSELLPLCEICKTDFLQTAPNLLQDKGEFSPVLLPLTSPDTSPVLYTDALW